MTNVSNQGEENAVSYCDNKSVGVIIKDKRDRYLIFDRNTFPPGAACAAGHVDDHGSDFEQSGAAEVSFEQAAVAEVSEELGLTVESLVRVTGGWRDNKCRRIPGPRGVGHEWVVYSAEVSGDLNPSESETKNARWLKQEELQALANRTVAYAKGEVTDLQFNASPGIEPVWVQWLVDAEVITVATEDLRKIDGVASGKLSSSRSEPPRNELHRGTLSNGAPSYRDTVRDAHLSLEISLPE